MNPFIKVSPLKLFPLTALHLYTRNLKISNHKASLQIQFKLNSQGKLELKKVWKPSIDKFTNGETNRKTDIKTLVN